MAIMGGTTGWQILTYENNVSRSIEFVPDELAMNSSDSVFGFLEESLKNTISSDGYNGVAFEEDEEEEEEEDKSNDNCLEEKKKFWDNQHHLLQATLCRTTALETGIRNLTKDALKEIQEGGDYCKCRQPVTGDGVSGCRSCLMREVSSKLRNGGYNTALCRSKWKTSSEIPAGEHTYLDIIDYSNPKKGDIRVIIELNLKAEFQMARSNEDYKQLISRLPEVFVGKDERLRGLIKILCSAAKKCMKDKKIHIGPWRKQNYVLAKWFSPCKRTEVNQPVRPINLNLKNRPIKASLLTMALLEMPRNVVAVM